MYINGPAGGAGIESYVESILAVENILVPKKEISYKVLMEEI